MEISEKYGTIEEMNVCDNVGEHMLGNVYIKVINDAYFATYDAYIFQQTGVLT